MGEPRPREQVPDADEPHIGAGKDADAAGNSGSRLPGGGKGGVLPADRLGLGGTR